MNLIDVYSAPEAARMLYNLLAEREPHQNISHRGMPTWEQHCAFLASRPYQAWYLIVDDAEADVRPSRNVGAIYLTKHCEVGLFVLKAHQGRGFGKAALAELRRLHPGRLLANIAPGNAYARRFFKAAGFRHIQNTYELLS